MNNADILCKCGHVQRIHTHWNMNNLECDGWINDGLEMCECECKEFDQDNLSYIEALAKQKDLV